MRKRLVTTNERGFIFPYICFLAAVILIVVTASLSLYQNHLELTRLQTERVKLETLLQMASSEFTQFATEEENVLQTSGQINYDYPYGTVRLLYTFLNPEEVVIEIHASTDFTGKSLLKTKITLNQ